MNKSRKPLHGHYDNRTTLRREVWREGQLVRSWGADSVERGVEWIPKWGTYPDSQLPPKVVRHVRMFKPEFAPLVESGAKCQTVRPTPRRLPKVGDRISLRMWTGKPYRSKQKILRLATIAKVEPVQICEGGMYRSGKWVPFLKMEEFSRADGFESPAGLIEWFKSTHGLPFNGVAIYWTNDENDN